MADSKPKSRKIRGNLNQVNISDKNKQEIWRLLFSLAQDPTKTSHAFPPTLTNEDRRYVHLCVEKLSLSSKSTGMKPNRFVTVYKSGGGGSRGGKSNKVPLPQFTLKPNSEHAIAQFLQTHRPPTTAAASAASKDNKSAPASSVSIGSGGADSSAADGVSLAALLASKPFKAAEYKPRPQSE